MGNFEPEAYLYFSRAIERIIIVLIGGGAIYLGYKLFKLDIDKMQSAEWSAGTFTFKLTRVGPGIFFAFFGAWLLYQVVNSNLESKKELNSNREANPPQISETNKNQNSTNQTTSKKNEVQTIRFFNKNSFNTNVKSLNTIIQLFDNNNNITLATSEIEAIKKSVFHLKSLRNEILSANYPLENIEIFEKNYDLYILDKGKLDARKVEAIEEMEKIMTESMLD